MCEGVCERAPIKLTVRLQFDALWSKTLELQDEHQRAKVCGGCCRCVGANACVCASLSQEIAAP